MEVLDFYNLNFQIEGSQSQNRKALRPKSFTSIILLFKFDQLMLCIGFCLFALKSHYKVEMLNNVYKLFRLTYHYKIKITTSIMQYNPVNNLKTIIHYIHTGVRIDLCNPAVFKVNPIQPNPRWVELKISMLHLNKGG